MKILIVLNEDTFKLDSISSKSYRDRSIVSASNRWTGSEMEIVK